MIDSFPAVDPDLPSPTRAPEQVRSYLVFRIGAGWYATAASDVLEVVAMPAASPIPAAPKVVHGLAQLSGRVAVILDGGRLLQDVVHSAPLNDLARRCVLLQMESSAFGISVDEIAGVIDVPFSALRAVSEDADSPSRQTWHDGERMISVLNVSAILEAADRQVRESDPWK